MKLFSGLKIENCGLLILRQAGTHLFAKYKVIHLSTLFVVNFFLKIGKITSIFCCAVLSRRMWSICCWGCSSEQSSINFLFSFITGFNLLYY